MSRFVRVGRFNDGSPPQSLAAHILGNVGGTLNYTIIPATSIVDQPVARFPSSFWEAPSHWEFIFSNSAPTLEPVPNFNFLSVYTNRSVLSSAVCTTPPFDFVRNTTRNVLQITAITPHGNHSVNFPGMALGEESIYYLTTPILKSHVNSTGICGLGCSTVHVVEPMAGPPAPESTFPHPSGGFFFYECNITVVPPLSSATPQYDLSPVYAAVAAQSIALSGQITPSIFISNSSIASAECASYAFGLEFGQTQNNSADGMARLLSRFAIGTVAAAAHTNPRVLVSGRPPRQGVRLVLEEPVAFATILCVASGLQLGLLVVAVTLVARLPGEVFELAWERGEGVLTRYLALGRPDRE